MTKVVLAVTCDKMTPLLNKGDVIIVDVNDNIEGRLTVVGIKGKKIFISSSQQTSRISGTLVSAHRQH